MDKLQDFIRVFKRVHFWVLTALCLLIGIGVWFVAKGKLNDEREQFVSKIKSASQKPPLVSRINPHPNDKVLEGMNALISATQNEIAAAWTKKWGKQVDILAWPEGLGPSFINQVKDLRPIETVDFQDGRNGLPSFQLESYAKYIRSELPKLAETIHAVWQVGINRRGGEDLDRRVEDAVVDWQQNSQEKIVKNHFEWSGGGRGGDPTTEEVLYAQEDFWVLRALMNVIQRTNGGAISRYRAAVKSIEDISIGGAATKSGSQVTAIGRDPGETGAADSQQDKRFGKQSFGKPSPQEDELSASSGPDPAEGRYVDENYLPLPASKLRSVMTAEVIQPEDAYLAVAKRIPVRMRVSIDQRQIEKLLVECANSELTVEVRDLLMTTKEDEKQQDRGKRGNRPTPLRRSVGRPDDGAEKTTNQFPYDVVVEIYGIVYLYNPVDKKALGITSDENVTAALQKLAR